MKTNEDYLFDMLHEGKRAEKYEQIEQKDERARQKLAETLGE